MYNLLVVDDDSAILSALDLFLKTEGFKVYTASSPRDALTILRHTQIHLILMDLNYSRDTTSGEEGLKLVTSIRELEEIIPIVVMTGWGSIEVAVASMQQGANDFIQKPWDNERLLCVLKNQLQFAQVQHQARKLKAQNSLLKQNTPFEVEKVCQSPAMQSVLRTLKQVAKSDVSVLFTGENGTGKSMFARYLHQHSHRSEHELVSVNMGAVTESLFESEMFGHTKGAFTDAKQARIGRFELADQGSLFLDEIANTPIAQQSKLLRVLEESQFERVGDSKTQSVDVRIITATNADLNQLVERGDFRKDLLYRINTVEIHIPSLRQRHEDIIPLAQVFLAATAQKYGRPTLTMDEQAIHALQNYAWPGNVRELNHVIERAQILCQNNQITREDLALPNSHLADDSNGAVNSLADSPKDDSRTLEDIEAHAIQQRLEQFGGDALLAADSLGLSRSAFYRRLGKAKS